MQEINRKLRARTCVAMDLDIAEEWDDEDLDAQYRSDSD
jgi:hypothetical protein